MYLEDGQYWSRYSIKSFCKCFIALVLICKGVAAIYCFIALVLICDMHLILYISFYWKVLKKYISLSLIVNKTLVIVYCIKSSQCFSKSSSENWKFISQYHKLHDDDENFCHHLTSWIFCHDDDTDCENCMFFFYTQTWYHCHHYHSLSPSYLILIWYVESALQQW